MDIRAPSASKGSVDLCERAIAATPADVDLPAYLAAVLSATGESDAARQQARRSATAGSPVGMFVYARLLDLAADQKDQDNTERNYWYRMAAQSGQPEALVFWAFILTNGRGAEKDETQAVTWLRKAAAAGHPIGEYDLGNMLATGRGVAKDDAEAAVWYRKAAEQGLAVAQNTLGARYQDGRGVQEDDTQAVEWYRKAAAAGNAWGEYNLAEMLSDGRGTAKSDVEAAAWYHNAADQGLARAQNALGVRYQDGRGVQKDDIQAVAWYRKAAAAGDDWGAYNLAEMLFSGRGTVRNDAEAALWYRKAADQGLAVAQNALGARYEDGRGVQSDVVQAVAWYRKAAVAGNARAEYNLAEMLSNGKGTAKDDVEAVAWYRRAADQGLPMAQNAMGVRYQDGRGVQKDDVQALAWYRKAAAAGDDWGEYNLAEMLFNGTGVPKNEPEATEWYRKAAEQGMVEAQLAYGIYLFGEQKYEDALKWLKLAAEAGYTNAQLFLGLMYSNGNGVPQDRKQALVWFRLAAAQGDTDGQVEVANLLREGGVAQELTEAHGLFEQAATRNDPGAQLALGQMYWKGEGGAQDIQKAIFWLSKALSDHDHARDAADSLCAIGTPEAITPVVAAIRSADGSLEAYDKAMPKSFTMDQLPDFVRSLNSLPGARRRTLTLALSDVQSPLAVPVLLAAIKDPDPDVQDAAGRALANIYSPSVRSGLLELVNDANPSIRAAAAKALGKLGSDDVVPALLIALHDQDTKVRQSAVQAIASIKPEEASAALIAALADSDPVVRREAASTLGNIGLADFSIPLMRAARDPVLEVRRAAVRSLGKVRSAEASTLLIGDLQDPDTQIRADSARALGQIKDHTAETALIGALRDKDEDVRNSAADALIEIKDIKSITPIIALLKDRNVSVRGNAARVLGEIKITAATPALAELATDQDPTCRRAAVTALANIDTPDAQPALRTALSDTSPQVRIAAAKQLAKHNSQEAILVLVAALDQPDARNRSDAADTLGDIRYAKGVERLAHLMRTEENLIVNHSAATALGEIGTPEAVRALIDAVGVSDLSGPASEALVRIGSDQAIAALQGALKSSDSEVQKHAAQALYSLGLVNGLTPAQLLQAQAVKDVRHSAMQQVDADWKIVQQGPSERASLAGLIARSTTRMPQGGLIEVQRHLGTLSGQKDRVTAQDDPYLLALLTRWLIEAGDDTTAFDQSTRALEKLKPSDRSLAAVLRWDRAEIHLLHQRASPALQEILVIEQQILPALTTKERQDSGLLFNATTLTLKARAELIGEHKDASIQDLFRAERQLRLERPKYSPQQVDDDDVLRVKHLIVSTRAKAQNESASADVKTALDLGRNIRDPGRLGNIADEDAFSVGIQHALGIGANDVAHALTEELAARRDRWASQQALSSADPARQASLTRFHLLDQRVQEATNNLQAAQKAASVSGIESFATSKDNAEGGSALDDSLSQLRREQQKAKADVQQFLVSLKSVNPEVALLIGAKPTDLVQLQKYLAPDQALLQYLVLDNTSYAFIITRESIQTSEIPVGMAQLKVLVHAYRDTLQDKPVCGDTLRPVTQANACRSGRLTSEALGIKLASLLIAPVQDVLHGFQKLTIVPNGPLHELPFAALPFGSQPMAGNFILNQLGSASLLSVVVRPVSAARPMLVLAVPDAPGWPHLSSADSEADAVHKQFPDAEVKSNSQAVSTLLVGRDLHSRPLHLATHAMASSADETRLALSDRDLGLSEVWGLALDDSPRVVLSACETSIGESLSGDEVVSLANGFLFAGARSVVASLWPVDDTKASELMSKMYTELARGDSTPQALALAQRQMIAAGAPASVWAAFMVTGQ